MWGRRESGRKHQAPSSKLQKSSKYQTPTSRSENVRLDAVLEFGVWSFFWSLELGFWCFRPAPRHLFPQAPAQTADEGLGQTILMGRKILIIDDDKVTRKVVGQALNGFDCQLLEAADGAEGLMIAQHERPELILLDYNMPVMDGPKTLAKLKTDPELRTLPVLMLTAESSRESVVRAVKLGVCGYLVKPFRAAELVERISRVLALEPRNPLAL